MRMVSLLAPWRTTATFRSVTVLSPMGAVYVTIIDGLGRGSERRELLGQPVDGTRRILGTEGALRGTGCPSPPAKRKARLGSKKVDPEASSTLEAGEDTERKTTAPASTPDRRRQRRPSSSTAGHGRRGAGGS